MGMDLFLGLFSEIDWAEKHFFPPDIYWQLITPGRCPEQTPSYLLIVEQSLWNHVIFFFKKITVN